jgi:hypothetical protein
VIRALRFFALFTAFFVVSVRCLTGLPLAAVCVALPSGGVSEACPSSDLPREHDSLAPVTLEETDDDESPVVAPSMLRIRLLSDAQASGADRGALKAQRVLSSHAPSLERPPRV